MSPRLNPNSGAPGPPERTAGREQQDTVLLGEVPEASDLIAERPAGPPLTPHLSSAALEALSQRYDILAEAGHGSMGNVYQARDRETGEIVALKLLKPEIASDQAMMERFKNELLFARKITHKNVCRVHEFNRIGGVAYTSMEFVEGESLRSALNRFGKMPPRQAVDLALQICSGLKEAHAQGIVHRDLKPENVMIDAQGNVKIMDFGIARSMEVATGLTGSMVGTPAYMAPEQVGGKPVDYRTDVYSLGLILYEMFTGTQAFRADNAVALALKQMRETPVPPHEIDPKIPVAIERCILKCLEKEPEKRFQSIASLENALCSQTVESKTTSAGVLGVPQFSIEGGRRTTSRPANFESRTLRRQRDPSPAVWAVLAAVVVFALLAGARSAKIRVENAVLGPFAPLPAPKPPSFAFKIPSRPAASAEAARTGAEPAEAPPAASKPATPTAVKRAAGQPPEPALPRDVERRAEKAFGETQSEPSFAAASRKGYIWVGRFEREDRAKSAVRKIHDLGGLEAHVAPRRGTNGQFFVVWAGPFGKEALPDNLDWLHAQGFAQAHEFPLPSGGMLGRRNQGQDAEREQRADRTPNP